MNLLIRKKNIVICRGSFVDPSALIGQKSLRLKSKKDLPLFIGEGAYILSGSVVYEGVRIGCRAIIGHNATIREKTAIGKNFLMWGNSVIDYECSIGDNVKLHSNVYIAPQSIIEDDVFLAPGVILANVIHPGCSFLKECMKGPVIKKGAQIGANVTINPYITIGENAMVGSGSVVTRDIPGNSFAYGNPAKIKGSIFGLKCKTGLTDRPYKKRRK
ncbi:MAG: acyltransferase [Candidatus Omnitrophica bacterium]|nr:acyltransferase [Candidatus Omnitrophota bacterium]MDD5553395.1 acyltransferase [Candidatus Omnitrophota bacterium]